MSISDKKRAQPAKKTEAKDRPVKMALRLTSEQAAYLREVGKLAQVDPVTVAVVFLAAAVLGPPSVK